MCHNSAVAKTYSPIPRPDVTGRPEPTPLYGPSKDQVARAYDRIRRRYRPRLIGHRMRTLRAPDGTTVEVEIPVFGPPVDSDF